MGVWRSALRDEKDISGCGVVGIMNEADDAFSGEAIVVYICTMMERGNGLGAGFAGYGIYPDFKDYWCFHIMYEEERARKAKELELLRFLDCRLSSPLIPPGEGWGIQPTFPSIEIKRCSR